MTASTNAPLILSLFPGIDLFGRAFEEEGFCVVRGPDLLWDGDIRKFRPVRGRFDGVIGGPPCQAFSSLLRPGDLPSCGDGVELVAEFLRCVRQTEAPWFLMENVARVPTVELVGYAIQRIDLRGGEVGLRCRRLRHFQFGSVTARSLAVPRTVTEREKEKLATASEGKRTHRRTWEEFCELQGIPALELPGMTRQARYQAVGNGVPLPMGRLLARAILTWMASEVEAAVCLCGCGRLVTGKQQSATPACRKRLERERKGVGVTRRRICDQAGSRIGREVTEGEHGA